MTVPSSHVRVLPHSCLSSSRSAHCSGHGRSNSLKITTRPEKQTHTYKIKALLMQTGCEIHFENLRWAFSKILQILLLGFTNPCYLNATLQPYPLLLLIILSGANYYFEFFGAVFPFRSGCFDAARRQPMVADSTRILTPLTWALLCPACVCMCVRV